MYEYLFVWDRPSDAYPLRYWVRPAAARLTEDAPPELSDLDGVVDAKHADVFLEALQKQYTAPRYAVSRMDATGWATVERNFPGLYLY